MLEVLTWLLLPFAGIYNYEGIVTAFLKSFVFPDWWCYFGVTILTVIPMLIWRIRCKGVMNKYDRGIAVAWVVSGLMLCLFSVRINYRHILPVILPESGLVIYAALIGVLLVSHWVIWCKAFISKQDITGKWLPVLTFCGILVVLGAAASHSWPRVVAVGILVSHLLRMKGGRKQ